MRDDVPNYIEEQVNEYKNETYDLLDYTKIIFFSYLVKRYGIDKFRKKINNAFDKYDRNTIKRLEKDYSKIDEMVQKINDKIETPKNIGIKPNKDELESLLFKLDKTSTKKSREVFIKRIENFYKSTEKTLKKEYIDEISYLSKKVSQYDKIQKVVPYYNKDGTVRAYFDIAGYNSMVYNTNLTSSAWNSTIKNAEKTGNDLVYVEPHPFSCPLCQEWQGKIYSLTSNNPIYPNIEEAIKGGLKHPNCKHNITEYYGQSPTNKYTSDEWVDRYNARQKKQSLELERKRVKNDIEIYKGLGNMEEVDKLNQRVKVLNSHIKDQKSLMNGEISNYSSSLKIKQKQEKEQEKLKIKQKQEKEKEIKKELQKQSSKTHKEMQELFKIRENRPKYIEELNRKQDKLKDVRKIIRKNKKDNAYYMAKQEELSLKVDIKNLKELINK